MRLHGPVAALGLLALLVVPVSNLASQESEATETLTKAVREIHDAIAEVRLRYQSNREFEEGAVDTVPRLRSARVRLRTATTTRGGGGLQLVVGGGLDKQNIQTQEIVLTFKPRDPYVAGVSPTPISEELVEAISTAYSAAQASIEAAPFLETSSFEVHIGLQAKTTLEGRVAFELSSLQVGVGGAKSEASIHSITLVFEG